ncbi:MAG: hypothetical protein AAB774_03000 [Patescibacteria group bacterium]
MFIRKIGNNIEIYEDENGNFGLRVDIHKTSIAATFTENFSKRLWAVKEWDEDTFLAIATVLAEKYKQFHLIVLATTSLEDPEVIGDSLNNLASMLSVFAGEQLALLPT